MKFTHWIPGLLADLAIVAAWAVVGWAAQQSISESDARRAAASQSAPPSHTLARWTSDSSTTSPGTR